MAGQAPDLGDILWLSRDPTAGHEQAGHRPVIVLSPRAYNTLSGLAIVVPVTSRQRGRPFEIPLPDGLPIRGAVLADQLRSIDWRARRTKYGGQLPLNVSAIVRATTRRLLE